YIETRIKKTVRDYCYPEKSQIDIANITKSLSDFLI
ncbi:unnamed protein product, partial [marine sediment metagenome]